MIKIFYHVEDSKAATELEWLKGQKIYPATQKSYIFSRDEVVEVLRIGVIVDDSAALAIKLRHPGLDSQAQWGKR